MGSAPASRLTLIQRRALRNTASNLAGKGVTLGFGLVLTPLLLHCLGASNYGLWALLNSVLGYGSLLDFGIAGAVTKYLAEYLARNDERRAAQLVATALWLYTLLGLLVLTIGALAMTVLPHFLGVTADHRIVSWLVILTTLLISLALPGAIPIAILRGLQRYDLINLIGFAGTVLVSLATLVVLLCGGGIIPLLAINLPITLMMQWLSLRLIRRARPTLRVGWRDGDRTLVRPILSFSSSLFIIQLSGQIQMKTDEVVIGVSLPLSAIAPYAIAHRLSDVAQLLTDQFLKILMPLASQLHAAHDRQRLQQLYLASTRLSLAIFSPLACTLLVLGKPILSIWVGEAYADASRLVGILVVASLIDTAMWPVGSVMAAMSRHRPIAIMSLGSAVVNLALSIILVRRFGVVGVAVGTLIPTSLEALLFVFPYAMRILGIGLRQALNEAFLPALFPAIPAIIVLRVASYVVAPQNLVSLAAVAAIGLAVYAAGYLRFGAGSLESQIYRGLQKELASRLSSDRDPQG